MSKITDQILATAIATLFLFPSSPVSANQRIDALGRDKLGKTLKEFQTRYPKTICSKAVSLEADSKEIHCCLNDRDSLKQISRFPILDFEDCAFQASFWKQRLHSLDYKLDVRSIQIVFDSFEKLYGPPTRVFRDPKDPDKLTFVDWMQGDRELELQLVRLGGEDKNSERWLEAVSVSLWSISLGSS